MKRYAFVQPKEGSDNPELVIMTEEEILKDYWVYWRNKMSNKFDENHHLILTKNCIEDWCVVHYAWEIKDG